MDGGVLVKLIEIDTGRENPLSWWLCGATVVPLAT